MAAGQRLIRVVAAQSACAADQASAAAMIDEILTSLEANASPTSLQSCARPLVDLIAFPEGFLNISLATGPSNGDVRKAIQEHKDWQILIEAVKTRCQSLRRSTEGQRASQDDVTLNHSQDLEVGIHPLFVLLGTCLERRGAKQHVLTILLGPDGVAGYYRKRYPDTGGGSTYSSGDDIGGIVDVKMRGTIVSAASWKPPDTPAVERIGLPANESLPFICVRLGLAICYDFEHEDVSNALLTAGATFVLNPVHIPRPPFQGLDTNMLVSNWKAAGDIVSRRWERHMLENKCCLIRVDLPQRCSGFGSSLICSPGMTLHACDPEDCAVEACLLVGESKALDDPVRLVDVLRGPLPERERSEWVDNSGTRWCVRSILGSMSERACAASLGAHSVAGSVNSTINNARSAMLTALSACTSPGSEILFVAMLDSMRVVLATASGALLCNNFLTGARLWQLAQLNLVANDAFIAVLRAPVKSFAVAVSRRGVLALIQPSSGTVIACFNELCPLFSGDVEYACVLPFTADAFIVVLSDRFGNELATTKLHCSSTDTNLQHSLKIAAVLIPKEVEIVNLHALVSADDFGRHQQQLVALVGTNGSIFMLDVVNDSAPALIDAGSGATDRDFVCCSACAPLVGQPGWTMILGHSSGEMTILQLSDSQNSASQRAKIASVLPKCHSGEASLTSLALCLGPERGLGSIFCGFSNGFVGLRLLEKEHAILAPTLHSVLRSHCRGAVVCLTTDGFRAIVCWQSGCACMLSVEQNRSPMRFDRFFSKKD